MAYHNQHHHLSQDHHQMAFQHFTDPASAPTATATPISLLTPKGDHPPHHHHHHLAPGPGPNWLSNALLRPQYGGGGPGPAPSDNASPATAGGGSSGSSSFQLHFQKNSDSPWLSRNAAIEDPVLAMPHESTAATSGNNNAADDTTHNNSTNRSKVELGDGGAGEGAEVVNWQNAKYKADILAHPLYEQLLSAHVACLRIATPVDQLPRIDAQLAQSQQVVAKYSALADDGQAAMAGDDKELDQFMTHYCLLLCSFKDQLQQHVRVHAMEAVMACWEIEQSLQSLTGVSTAEGTGATMSDDDDDPVDSDTNLFDGGFDGADTMGFGPLVPTESERSLMERVRHELKHELKQGYKEKIVDIREEILRKRRAGKLPGDTTSVLKAWWQTHSKWPYPTEEDKTRLVQETGLQLKQINNWFINQRKRNWHSNPSGSTATKSKRKR